MCSELGVSASGLRFVRQSGNAVFKDDEARIVVRVPLAGACPLWPTDAHLSSLRRLAESGAPVVAPLVPRVIPIADTNQVMTLWPLLIAAPRASGVEVAKTLSDLHASEAVEDLASFDLSRLAPEFGRHEQAALSLGVPTHAVRDSRTRTERSWSYLSQHCQSTPVVVVHRDPYPDNMAWDPSGRLVWIDLDEVCLGPRELDLAMIRKLARRFGGEFPAAADEEAMLDAYRHEFDWELLDALNVVSDFEGAMQAIELWELMPTTYNKVRAAQRLGTLASPREQWLTY